VTLRNASASGTYVNGKLVCDGRRRRLALGDRISFVEPRHARGHLLFRLRALGPMGALFGALSDDDMRAILARLDPDDLVNARLACRAFREHSEPPAVKRRSAYLRSRALAAYAWEALPGYEHDATRLLRAHKPGELHADSATTSLDLRCARAPLRAAARSPQSSARARASLEGASARSDRRPSSSSGSHWCAVG
jgi:hypothetical protein